jgi:crossover junction endodeoxyribonuclease RusA
MSTGFIVVAAELPGVPPTVNHYIRHTRDGRHYKTKEAREWQETAATLIALSYRARAGNGHPAPYKGLVEFKIDWYSKTWGKEDADNRIKAAQDCLALAGVIEDDRQVKRCVAEKHPAGNRRGKTVITVSAIDERGSTE